jgi:hypothetical protein
VPPEAEAPEVTHNATADNAAINAQSFFRIRILLGEPLRSRRPGATQLSCLEFFSSKRRGAAKVLDARGDATILFSESAHRFPEVVLGCLPVGERVSGNRWTQFGNRKPVTRVRPKNVRVPRELHHAAARFPGADIAQHATHSEALDMSLKLVRKTMVRRVILLGVATLGAMGAAEAGCSSNGGSSGSGSNTAVPGTTTAGDGTIGLKLALPGGDTISSVTFTLENSVGTLIPLGVANPGTVAVTNSASIDFQIGGVPAGSGDSITLAATTRAGASCQGSATGIAVAASATTNVTVQMLCASPGPDSGNVFVTGSLNYCGTWTGLSSGSNGSEAFVGETITLNATAIGGNPNNLGYTWTQTPVSPTTGPVGVLGPTGTSGPASDEAAGPSDAIPFMCTSPGTATITLTVDDGPVPAGTSCPTSLSTVTTTVVCDPYPANQVEAAWVELGPNGPIARALTANATCPTITTIVSGVATTQTMNLRVAAGTIPLRTTISTTVNVSTTPPTITPIVAGATSKPSVYPVNTCELSPLPTGTTSAVVNASWGGGPQGITLPLPKANPQTIGDVWQDCNQNVFTPNGSTYPTQPNGYPFATTALNAAALHPDLVIHVGDYMYRDNECPPDIAGCAGSPWGYGWDGWEADFFTPAAPLLAAAPWIVVRGNHEQCTRSGQGWYRFLDPNPYDSTNVKTCNLSAFDIPSTSPSFATSTPEASGSYNTAYGVSIGSGTQVLVFDSNNVSKSAITSPGSGATLGQFTAYTNEAATIAGLAVNPSAQFNIWANHHPILGFSEGSVGATPTGGQPALLSVLEAAYPTTVFPSGINMVLHGHTHLFEAIDFSPIPTGTANGYPATFVSGNAGTQLDTALPSPFPLGLSPLNTVPESVSVNPNPPTVSNIADSPDYGFLVMQYQAADASVGAGWAATEYGEAAPPAASPYTRTTCTATLNGQVSCNTWGFIP